jgi:hypothetical protein
MKISVASMATALIWMSLLSTNSRAMSISGTPSDYVKVGSPYYFKPTLNGANPCGMCFRVSNLPSWASYSPRTGAITGTPNVAGAWRNVTIEAWDGVHFAVLPAFTITAGRAAAAAPSAAVRIWGAPSTSAEVGQFYTFTPTVTAPVNASLTYRIVNRPGWARFNASTGTLYGTPNSTGTNSGIAISVSDIKTSASLGAFAIRVNAAPPGMVQLSWSKPERNTDGSSLTNLAGYRIYYGNASTALNKQIELYSANTTSAMIENLSAGTWYFAIASRNTDNIVSASSTVISASVPN